MIIQKILIMLVGLILIKILEIMDQIKKKINKMTFLLILIIFKFKLKRIFC